MLLKKCSRQERTNINTYRDVSRAPKGLSTCPKARSTMPFLTAVSLTCFFKKLTSTQMRRKEIFTSSERDLSRKNSLTNCLVALSATVQPLWVHSQGLYCTYSLGQLAHSVAVISWLRQWDLPFFRKHTPVCLSPLDGCDCYTWQCVFCDNHLPLPWWCPAVRSRAASLKTTNRILQFSILS